MLSRLTVAVVFMTLFGLLTACTSTGNSGPEPSGTVTSHSFAGIPTVGALFRPGDSQHVCTASVVASPAHNLLLTAAHCISGTVHGYTFAPGYHNGSAPLGTWTVVKAYGDPAWLSHQAPQSDFAFLVVAPNQVNGIQQEIQDITGANQLGSAPPLGESITVPAYPNGADNPITCTAPVYYQGAYPAFLCAPYPDGTSGGPLLVQGPQGPEVVGVIGGPNQGGCAWAVFSAAFGPATLSAYANATAGAQPSTFPQPRSSGC